MEPPRGSIPLIGEEMLDDRVDFERGMSLFPLVAVLLIVANVFAFGFELLGGALKSTEAVVAVGAKDTAAVLHGDWWRLFSAMFLHGSLDHLVGNMAALYVLGVGCEHAFGRGFTFAAYVWTGLVASLASCLNSSVSVGASGAIFGLLGLLGSSLYRYRARLEVQNARVGGVLLFWAGYAVLGGVLSPMIDNLAHAGGLLAGLLLGLRATPRSLEVDGGRPEGGLSQAAALAAAGVLACAGWRFIPLLTNPSFLR